jgi:hypothetical protein
MQNVHSRVETSSEFATIQLQSSDILLELFPGRVQRLVGYLFSLTTGEANAKLKPAIWHVPVRGSKQANERASDLHVEHYMVHVWLCWHARVRVAQVP